MLDHDGRLMLIDFGIATRFAPQRIGTTIGTPGYAPPEQYQGLAEPRSDLYALAATLHHLITGRDPTREPPFLFPALDPDRLRIPPALARMIADSLSFIIAERPATVADFRTALFSRSSIRPVRAGRRQVVRYDLRHASRVASQNWSPQQRELVEAHIPKQIELLRKQGMRADADAAGAGVTDEASLLRVQALRQEAERLEGMGHYAKALGALDQALTLQSTCLELWLDKARVLRLAGKLADAATAYREALRLDPDRPPILSSMGWCLAHAGQHLEALAVLEKALVLDPLDVMAWAAKGWSLACLKRLHEALRALEEATGLDPHHAEAWRTRGWCLERLGLDGEAMRAFRQAQRAG
jgi:tetratricopeptide (TPR) repeat protein